jgi:hypothetical protein
LTHSRARLTDHHLRQSLLAHFQHRRLRLGLPSKPR